MFLFFKRNSGKRRQEKSHVGSEANEHLEASVPKQQARANSQLETACHQQSPTHLSLSSLSLSIPPNYVHPSSLSVCVSLALSLCLSLSLSLTQSKLGFRWSPSVTLRFSAPLHQIKIPRFLSSPLILLSLLSVLSFASFTSYSHISLDVIPIFYIYILFIYLCQNAGIVACNWKIFFFFFGIFVQCMKGLDLKVLALFVLFWWSNWKLFEFFNYFW